MIGILVSIFSLDNNFLGGGALYHTSVLCYDADTGVNGSLAFDTGTNNRSFCGKQRYSLTLHVGSHQGTVRVIVL